MKTTPAQQIKEQAEKMLTALIELRQVALFGKINTEEKNAETIAKATETIENYIWFKNFQFKQ